MILPDVNVLVYAHRSDAPNHEEWSAWLRSVVSHEEPFGLAAPVLTGFLRVVSHPRVYQQPTPIETALAAVEALRARPNAVVVAPGRTHWEVFTRLCRESGATGNLVPDAYLAALAIESGAELLTTDRDFTRFSGLRWRHPLATA